MRRVAGHLLALGVGREFIEDHQVDAGQPVGNPVGLAELLCDIAVWGSGDALTLTAA